MQTRDGGELESPWKSQQIFTWLFLWWLGPGWSAQPATPSLPSSSVQRGENTLEKKKKKSS